MKKDLETSSDTANGPITTGDQRPAIVGRPKKLTEEMKFSAATKTAEALAHDGLIPGDEIESHAKDIAKYGREHMDGYELARNLESRAYWDCNLQMAEALDAFSWNARREIDDAEREWAKQTNPQPPLAIGTKIELESTRGEVEAGVIDAIYDHGPAKYLVKIDGDPKGKPPTNSRRVINFEDAKAIDAIPDRSETTQSQPAR